MLTRMGATRRARADEEDEIAALIRAAFGRLDEAGLVRRLRADGDMWLELVKPCDGVIAGYAALSRMRAPIGWACLAPVAVHPRFQRGGAASSAGVRTRCAVGTGLVGEIVQAVIAPTSLREPGQPFPSTVVVLGRPGFYERAGFSLARASKLVSPYPIDHTLIARPGDDVPVERLIYPAAFGELD